MNYFKNILNFIIALMGLNFVILIHEFGHFSFCKLFDVRTPTFSVGFNPPIVSHKFRGTKFQVGAIPLGGYVSINEQDLASKAYPKKIAIILAGILFNIIFSFLVLYYLYSKRRKTVLERIDHAIEESSSSYHTGLTTIADFIIKATPDEARDLLKDVSRSRFIGPIGILSMITKSVNLGFDTFIYFLATVSLNIGFFNLFPLSFLDGGQAAYYTFQALFGNKFIGSFTGNISYIIVTLALIFLLIISLKDIFNLRKK